MAATYTTIVARYRARIESGRLQPGDRLPSTRALAAEWGVAPATAARVLTELTRAGLTRTQPRVGTVVAPRPGERGLDRTRVVAAGIAVADEVGVAGLSMRSVAARLDAAPMSLYRYIDGKDALLLAMADTVYGFIDSTPDTGQDWRRSLATVGHDLWAQYRAHPWLAVIGSLARPLPLPKLMRQGDRIASALQGTGLPPARVLELQIVLFAHVQGLAGNLEREAVAREVSGRTAQQWEDAQLPRLRRIAASDGLIALAGVIDGLVGGYDFDLDMIFEIGLNALLDGFATLVAREGGSARRPGDLV